MSTLVLGSKPLEDTSGFAKFQNVFAANGAVRAAADFCSESMPIAVCTPYIFLHDFKGSPYQHREPLRRAMLDAVNSVRPDCLFLRPVTVVSRKELGSRVHDALSYKPSQVQLLNRMMLSWNLMRLSGLRSGEVVSSLVRSRVRGLWPVQEPGWKVSTGLLALAIALMVAPRDLFPLTLAGIGVSNAPYPEAPAFEADRTPHISADLAFLRLIRKKIEPNNLIVVDPDLDRLTSAKFVD